jgi:hypothetical protein
MAPTNAALEMCVVLAAEVERLRAQRDYYRRRWMMCGDGWLPRTRVKALYAIAVRDDDPSGTSQ